MARVTITRDTYATGSGANVRSGSTVVEIADDVLIGPTGLYEFRPFNSDANFVTDTYAVFTTYGKMLDFDGHMVSCFTQHRVAREG